MGLTPLANRSPHIETLKHTKEAPHPVDVARKNLEASVKGLRRAALHAKIDGIRHGRADDAQARFLALQNEHNPRPKSRDAVAIPQCWEAVLTRSQTAATEIVTACFVEGVKNNALIVDYVREDLKHFLYAHMKSRFGHGSVGTASQAEFYTSGAGQHAARVEGQVIAMRADFEKSQPHMVERIKQAALRKRWIAYPVLIITGVAAAWGFVDAVRSLWALVKTP